MCCSSNSPKSVVRLFVRIGFGLALAFTGFAHYQDPLYAETVGRGLGILEPLGMVWGYVLPGLMIVGGLLLAFGIYMNVAAYLTAIALAFIPAGVMLKSAISGIPLEDMMPLAMNAWVWVLVLMIAVKGAKHSCCGPACSCDPSCGCGCNDVPSAAPMKSVAVPPMAKKTMPVKKTASKKK